MNNNDTKIRFCQNCGTELQPEAQFCPICGTKLNDSPIAVGLSNSTNKSKNVKKTLIITFIIVLLLIIAAGVVLLATGKIRIEKEITTQKPSSTENADASQSQSEVNNETTTTKESDHDSVEIPDLVGTDIESAKQLIISLGLVPKVSEMYSTQLKGIVCSTEPEIGTVIKKGSTVELYSSLGYFLMYARGTSGSTIGIPGEDTIIDGGYFNIDSVVCNYGRLTIDFTICGFREKIYERPFIFYPTIPTNLAGGYVTINENDEKAAVDYTATITSPEDATYETLEKSVIYTQKVTITSDISTLEGSDYPRVIEIRVPIGLVISYHDDLYDIGFAKIRINTDSWECEQEIVY